MSERVVIREVGLRDGLQLVKVRLDTDIKLKWIIEQAASGFSEIEVTSFVPAKILPQFSDAEIVLNHALSIPRLTASVLVPNLKGAFRAIEAGAQKISFVLSASDAHNQSNVRCSTDDSLAMFRDLRQEIKPADGIIIVGAIATSFGCSIQKEVEGARVVEIATEMAHAGADEINLADTVGYANPYQVKKLFSDVAQAVGDIPLAAHFHDTRGFGLANVVAALETGVRFFDSALGGLGGCPFAPGATGNIPTEDTVNLLKSLGMHTGVDLPKLIKLRRLLSNWLPNEKLHGKLIEI